MNAPAIHSSEIAQLRPNQRNQNVHKAIEEIGRQADLLMLILIAASALLALPIGWHYTNIDIALIISPIIIALAAAAFWLSRGTAITRYALPLLLCATIALQIQVALGTIEFHFGVFVTLALIMVYRDWRVVLACAAFFAVHHVLFDRLQAWGYGIYCTTEADFMRIVLHATFVIIQTAVEIFIIKNMAQSYRQGIELQSLVQVIHDGDKFNLHITQEAVSTPLAAQLKAIILKLDETVRTVTHSVTQVMTASREIEMGSSDLSSRTEMACSALEATSSAAARVMNTVEQARVRASEADSMTRQAADTAHKGQTVISDLAQSMASISKQSEQIAEIVNVVDSLAFQTNLLALNAAVEAARAGEQGRGFAVVAEEVRRLALRSAESAKQIRALIQTSEASVHIGATQSQEALKTMQQLLEASNRATEHMREIVSAPHEQNTAMASIAEAIHALESSMSQNSALAEESSAAAASLQDQTEQMAHSVQAFRT